MDELDKAQEELDEQEVVARLDAGQYYEWLATIEQMKVARLEHQVLFQDCKITHLKADNYKLIARIKDKEIGVKEDNVKSAEAEYNKIKEKLEKNLGCQMKDVTINEAFEVRKIPGK